MNDAEAALPNDVALCHELIRQQAPALDQAQRRIEQLEHSVDLLLRQRFGPRSERIDPNRLRLFTEEDDEPFPSTDLDDVPESPAKPGATGADGRRQPRIAWWAAASVMGLIRSPTWAAANPDARRRGAS